MFSTIKGAYIKNLEGMTMITDEVYEIERSDEFDLLSKHYASAHGNNGSENLISVIYFDNSAGMVKPEELDELIKKRIILSFRRAEGWVRISGDPIRENAGKYEGPERRRR